MLVINYFNFLCPKEYSVKDFIKDLCVCYKIICRQYVLHNTLNMLILSLSTCIVLSEISYHPCLCSLDHNGTFSLVVLKILFLSLASSNLIKIWPAIYFFMFYQIWKHCFFNFFSVPFSSLFFSPDTPLKYILS